MGNIQPYKCTDKKINYSTHSNDWIDAAKRWYEYQDISQKKQNFCTCLLSLRENYIDIEVQSYLKKKSKYGKIADEKCKIGYEY